MSDGTDQEDKRQQHQQQQQQQLNIWNTILGTAFDTKPRHVRISVVNDALDDFLTASFVLEHYDDRSSANSTTCQSLHAGKRLWNVLLYLTEGDRSNEEEVNGLVKVAVHLIARYPELLLNSCCQKSKLLFDNVDAFICEARQSNEASYVYAAVALAFVRGGEDMSEVLLDEFMRAFVLNNFASSRMRVSLSGVRRFLLSDCAVEGVNNIILPPILAKMIAQPSAVTASLLHLLPCLDKDSIDMPILEKIVQFGIKRLSEDLLYLLLSFSPKLVIESCLDSGKLYNVIARYDNDGVKVNLDEDKIEKTIQCLLPSFKKDKNGDADMALAKLFSLSLHKDSILEALCNTNLKGESLRVLSVFYHSGIDFDKYANLQSEFRKLSETLKKKQPDDVIILSSYLGNFYNDKLLTVDVSNEFAHLIPSSVMKLKKLTDDHTFLIIKLAICGNKLTRSVTFKVLESLVSSKYQSVLVDQLYQIALSRGDGISFAHEGSVRKCAALLSNQSDLPSSQFCILFQLLHYGFQKSNENSEAISDLLLRIDDIEKFSEGILDCVESFQSPITCDKMIRPSLMTLLYLDHETLQPLSSIISCNVASLSKKIEDLSKTDWAQTGLPNSVLYNDPKDDNLTSSKPTKKMSSEEQWEEEIRREMTLKQSNFNGYSAEEKDLLVKQVERRKEVAGVLTRTLFSLKVLDYLFSDKEVINSYLCCEHLVDNVLNLYHAIPTQISGVRFATFYDSCNNVKDSIDLKKECYISVTNMAACMHERETEKSSALAYSLIFVSMPKITTAGNFFSKILNCVNDLVHKDIKYDCGSFYMIVKLCDYALREETLSMHDADTILRFLNDKSSTVPSFLVDSILQFSARHLFIHRCVDILTSALGNINESNECCLLQKAALSESKSVRFVAMQTLSILCQTRGEVLKEDDNISKLAWLNSHDENANISGACKEILLNMGNVSEESRNTLTLMNYNVGCISQNATVAFAHSLNKENVSKGLKTLVNMFIENTPDETVKTNNSLVAPIKEKTIKKPIVKKKVVKKSPSIGGIGRIGQAPNSRKVKSSKLAKDALKPKAVKKVDKSVLVLGSTSNKEIEDNPEKRRSRMAVLMCIMKFSVYTVPVKLVTLIEFLTSWAICDPFEDCRTLGYKALSDIVGSYTNEENLEEVMKVVKDLLKSGKAPTAGGFDKKAPSSIQAEDFRKEGAVLALGSCALHLTNTDDIVSILDQLISVLSTPSADVQQSIALTIVKLMKKVKDIEIIERMLKQCLVKALNETSSLATKKGGAFGVAAIVKGKGISSLKKFNVISSLQSACVRGEREGALYVIEQLDSFLKLLFEPYVLQLLPSIIQSFTDGSTYVRDAASDCVRVIMSNLSNHGVKLVLPVILNNFKLDASESKEEKKDEWRAKVASLRILGSVGSISPKFVSQYLPKVIPVLIVQHESTNKNVKDAATEALDSIVSTIQNPEISSLSGKILDALVDGSGDKRLEVLEGLIEKNFVHAIDTPSISITMPIISRSLRPSSPSTHKRLACLILATFCEILEDVNGMSGYIEELLELLISVLMGGQSQVRSVAAKAMGAMVRHLSTKNSDLEGLLASLQSKLISNEITSIERSGISSGFAQVLFSKYYQDVDSLYSHVTNILLPVLNTNNMSAHEGVLWVFVYLPTTMSANMYTPLIDPTVPLILRELDLDKQTLTETVIRALRVLISTQEIGLILPSIMDGCKSRCDNTRAHCIELLGDLLYKLAGNIEIVEKAEANISSSLISHTRKEVLSILYFARCDVASAHVRNNALNVWKNIVSNTPRTLRAIMPELTTQIITNLATDDLDGQNTSGRCLAELSSKLGESILKQVLPLFESNLMKSSDINMHRGVCIGLKDVISNLSKDDIETYLSKLVSISRIALCSEDKVVQKLAAGCFQSLYNQMGTKSLESIVPNLLAQMSNSATHDRAINGLTQILAIRSVSKEILPYIIPRLLSRPLSVDNLEVLTSIMAVVGASLHLYLYTLLPSLIEGMRTDDDRSLAAIETSLRCLCKNVENVIVLIGDIVGKCDHDDEFWRLKSVWMLGVVAEERNDKADFYDQISVFFRELILRLNDDSTNVLKATNAALTSITKNVPAEVLVENIEYIRNHMSSVVSDARRRKGGVGDGDFFMPAFNMPKGLEPLWPIYQRGILYGNATIREVSASGLGDVLSYTMNKYFAGPLVIKMTGPLLRVVGDRNPSSVKISIVKTLGIILTKGGPALRAFVPQFQTTFVKALSDPSRSVRSEATAALALLVPLSTRIDPLIKELVSGSLGRSVSVAGIDGQGLIVVQTTMLLALAGVLETGGTKAKLPDTIPAALAAAEEILESEPEDEMLRDAAEKVVEIASSL